MRSPHFVIVGGGAAGFFGAIQCAETHPHVEVTLLEAGRQPLAKVRVSGGGRCNVTHACFEPSALVQNYPRGGKALLGAFSRFQPRDVVDWFEDRDVTLKTEADGRMFPTTDDSATIVDCLTWAAQKAGVTIRTGTSVVGVEKVAAQKFEIALKSGEMLWCDRLLLATGSSPQGYQIARSLGHHIEPPVPSLFTFNIADPKLQELAGVSVPLVRLQLTSSDPSPSAKVKPAIGFEQIGPLLVTHWGLSGPAVLKLSAWGAKFLHDLRYQAALRVNWLPQLDREALDRLLLETKAEVPKRAIANYAPFELPRRLWQYFVAKAGIDSELRWSELSKKAANQLVRELTDSHYAIAGKGVFKEEFVTCGGVNLKEVDFKTMESRICQGLFFGGEVLDIDGVTGGFNFQSAWTTAWLAGQAMGKS